VIDIRTRIYTDGSYNNKYDVGSWAFVAYDRKSVISFTGTKEKNTTNNNMELKAVNEALAFSLLKKYKDVEIITDSAYVINTINRGLMFVWKQNDWRRKNNDIVKNKKEWEDFYRLTNKFKKANINLTFTKTKSHSNNSMNNKADSLAKQELTRLVAKG
jgi:ribonuclease HI